MTKGKYFGLGLFLAGAVAAEERQLHVLLSRDTLLAEMVVEPASLSAGQPHPLSLLGDGSATRAHYLVPIRPDHHFRDYLAMNPGLARAKLDQYVVLDFPPGTDVGAKLASFANSQHVLFAHVPVEASLAAGGSVAAASAAGAWHPTLGLPGAWTVTSGWGAVGVLDSGADVDHPALIDVAGGKLTGGNLLGAATLDIGLTGFSGCPYPWSCAEPNVDEAEPIALGFGSFCDADGDLLGVPAFAGHGTHVAGLVAGVGNATGAGAGACRRCPMSVWRVTYATCNPSLKRVEAQSNHRAVDAGITLHADAGIQVINLSLTRNADAARCAQFPDSSECLAVQAASGRDVMLVAASGNDRGPITFPAGDARVVAVGGIDAANALWNRDVDPAPFDVDGCPASATPSVECGSNYTTQAGGAKQELVAPAESVDGLAYPGMDWNAAIGCGSSIGGPIADGYGNCTGTSMSSAMVAGLAGLLRSVNPLLRTGDPESSVDLPGIRDVLVATTAEAQLGQIWDPKLGYGRPDAAAAVRRVLGTVGGRPVRNRATPLFTFYSAAALDHAQTAIPQAGRAFLVNGYAAWLPDGPLVAGYVAFPDEPNAPVIAAPRARAFVLTTPSRTHPSQPTLVPLYGLERSEMLPGAPFHRDFMLATDVAHVEQALAAGYRHRGVQGYVFARCTPEPACIPTGAVRLLRRYHAQRHDAAIFPEDDLAGFAAQGYVETIPPGTNDVLGYAYRNVDADGDGLVDGFERLIGTNPASADSDADGTGDGVEYPPFTLPMSDPCSTAASGCSLDALHFDSFETH